MKKAYGKGHDNGDRDVVAVDPVDPEQVRLGKIALVGISNCKGNMTTHLVLEAIITGMEMTAMDTIPSGQTVEIHHICIINMWLSDNDILLGNQLTEVIICIDEYPGQTSISILFII